MAEALYRKYRPQFFADITGQEHIVNTLCAQLVRGTVSHAYLFSGTRGTGKTTSARVFAKALNCRNRPAESAEPCGACVSCEEIMAGRSIDVIEMDAATHTGVDVVREHIIEHARTLPTRDRYKIFIIDEVHMLSTSSFNALLKTLEEPPAHVVYLLATTELHKIPATVASRCQRFLFRPLPPTNMAEKLRRIAAAEFVVLDDSVVGRIIGASGGAMRDAESILGQLMAMDASHITDAQADLILSPRYTEECIALLSALNADKQLVALEMIENLYERGTDLMLLYDQLIAHAHELLVIGATGRIPEFLGVFSESESALLLTASRGIKTQWLGNCMERLLAQRHLHKTVSSPLIPLHVWIAGYETTHQNDIRKEPVVTEMKSDSYSSPDENRVQKNWEGARERLAELLPSVGIMLSSAQLVSLTGTHARIHVPVALYCEKLSDIAVKKQLEDILSEGCGVRIACSFHVAPVAVAAVSAPAESPLVDAALSTFGGTVVA